MGHRWRSMMAGLVLVTAVACGGGGTEEDAVGPAPVTGQAGDQATARTIVLQQADMPSGWRGTPHTETPEEQARARAFSLCLGRSDPTPTRSATVYGPDLSNGQIQVSSVATVLKTVEDAKADLDAVRGPKYGDCVATALREDLRRQAPDARIEDVAVEPLPVEQFGDGSVGVRLTASLVYPDRTEKLFADVVYMSKDRATASATFSSFAQPFPATLQQSM
ncbi:MAG TPA: hypothetical protein VHE80_07935, partial [Acidimicrobiales bacterium]|nr:hypothetical protein [Acidimicrobiales bacterium]